MEIYFLNIKTTPTGHLLVLGGVKNYYDKSRVISYHILYFIYFKIKYKIDKKLKYILNLKHKYDSD